MKLHFDSVVGSVHINSERANFLFFSYRKKRRKMSSFSSSSESSSPKSSRNPDGYDYYSASFEGALVHSEVTVERISK